MCMVTCLATELLRNILQVHVFLSSFPGNAFYPNPAKTHWQMNFFLSDDISTWQRWSWSTSGCQDLARGQPRTSMSKAGQQKPWTQVVFYLAVLKHLLFYRSLVSLRVSSRCLLAGCLYCAGWQRAVTGQSWHWEQSNDKCHLLPSLEKLLFKCTRSARFSHAKYLGASKKSEPWNMTARGVFLLRLKTVVRATR